MEESSSQELSPAQAEIMEIVWACASGEVTAAGVREELAKTRDLARNTVRTLLERMEEKGWLTHREEGRTFYYAAARPRTESIGQHVREMVDTLCGGSPELLVAALIDYRGLKAGELKRIRQMLDDAKARRNIAGGA
jgi:BlaI family transcriptional regulator, penicillinase repressor